MTKSKLQRFGEFIHNNQLLLVGVVWAVVGAIALSPFMCVAGAVLIALSAWSRDPQVYLPDVEPDTPDADRWRALQDDPEARLLLIDDIARRCYHAWDTWDIGDGPYGVQLAYLFAAIADPTGVMVFALDREWDREADLQNVPMYWALYDIFPPTHDIWLFINTQSGYALKS